MTAELTSEEIVTNLLISNSLIKRSSNSAYISNPNNLGKYLSENNFEEELKPVSKYSFINESLNWGF